MTVTLTQDTANAKVIVTATQLSTATRALIERSMNQVQWTTVRGGVSLPASAGAFVTPLDDYEFTPGVTNHYRVSADPKGLYLPGTSGNYASTPDNAALDITGDIDLRADVTMPGYVSAGYKVAVGKWTSTGDQRSYLLAVSNLGKIQLAWSTAGTNATVIAQESTVAVPVASGRLAIRATLDVNNGAGGSTITFYTAPTIAGPWTQLGSPVISVVTSIFSGTAVLEAGSVDLVTVNLWAGTVHAVEVRNGINGTAAANPDFTIQDHLDTSFADAAGRTWTINGTAQILTTQSATVVPFLDTIWLKSLTRPFLNRAWTIVGFSDPVRPARSTEHEVVGRTMPAARNDIRGSRRWSIDVYVKTAADAQTLDYVLASGDVLLLHVPRLCDVPGGYVQVKNYGQRHPEGRVHGAARIFTLPLVEAAPPGPDVAATIGTWTTVLAGYASWDAVLAAFPTWEDLLALHGDPAEVIVQ